MNSRKNMRLVFLWGRYKNSCMAEGKIFYSYYYQTAVRHSRPKALVWLLVKIPH